MYGMCCAIYSFAVAKGNICSYSTVFLDRNTFLIVMSKSMEPLVLCLCPKLVRFLALGSNFFRLASIVHV